MTIRRDSKRQALLQAGLCELADKGFHGTHVAEVAERVQIRKSTFFHYFADKEALCEEAVEKPLHALADHLELAIAGASTVLAQIDAVVAALADAAARAPDLARVLLRQLFDAPPPGIRQPTAMARIATIFVNLVAKGVRERTIPSCEIQPTALSVLTLVCSREPQVVPAVCMPPHESLIGVTHAMRVADIQAKVRVLLSIPLRTHAVDASERIDS